MSATSAETSLAEDMLQGAEAIATFIFGTPKARRKVYHLTETSRLPIFKLGAVLCARKSVIMRWIAEQEERTSRAAALAEASVHGLQERLPGEVVPINDASRAGESGRRRKRA